MRKLPAGVWSLFVVALLFAAPAAAGAQEAAAAAAEPAVEEVKRPWTNEGELLFVATSGNTSATNWAIRDKFTYNFTYSELILYVDLLKATNREDLLFNEDGGVRQEKTTRTTAEQYEAGAKYRQNFYDRAFWYALGSWYANDPSGISSRLSGGGGAGYRFVENDNTKLIGEAGLALTHESQTSDVSDTFVDLRAFGEWQQVLNENADLSLTAEFIDSVQDFDKLRINSRLAVTAHVTKVLALRLSWDMRFNNDPPSVLVDTVPDEEPAYFQLRSTDRVLGGSLLFVF